MMLRGMVISRLVLSLLSVSIFNVLLCECIFIPGPARLVSGRCSSVLLRSCTVQLVQQQPSQQTPSLDKLQVAISAIVDQFRL